jgi:aspartate racemase
MQGRFYSDVFSKAGIVLAVPKQEEQAFVHDKYMNELLNGIIRPETRERLLAIVDQLKEREHIEGVILAGTELPLILRDADQDIAFLDTTEIHVKAALAAMLA